VRNAYHMEMNRLAQSRGDGLGANNHVEVWKTIWGLSAPPVLKNFCWKVCNNLLPTKVNLQTKKIIEVSSCPFCNAKPTTIFHYLWGCPAAVAVWQEGDKKFQKMSCDCTDGLGLFLYFVGRLDLEERVKAWIVARMIWNRRNDFVFNGLFSSPMQVMAAAKASVEGCNLATSSAEAYPKVMQLPQPKWKKPPEGTWKINWDVAVSKESMTMEVGIVIRDEGGRFVAAKMEVVPYIVDPNAAETIAAWSAVQFGREMGANRSVLEGDSMVVASALRASESCDRLFGQLIDDIKSYFSHFLQWK
jgi:hypothetical protein